MSDTTPGATRMAPHPADRGRARGDEPDREVAAYVRLVRAGLADLPPEDVDDLTAGMEADLADMVADQGGSIRDHLGPPQVYATELRRAAGLPPAAGVPGKRGLYERIGSWEQGIARRRQHSPAFDEAMTFLDSLRPAWWVVRGLTVAAVFVAWPMLILGVPGTALVIIGVPAAIIAIIVSGRRGLKRAGRGATPPGLLSNVFLGVVALSLVFLLIGAAIDTVMNGRGDDAPAAPPVPPGVADGPVNLYVYDANGRRVNSARIFDADGNPVRLNSAYEPEPQTPPRDIYGATQPNVFPRHGADMPDPWDDPAVSEGGWTPPVSIAPLQPAATPTGTPTPSPSSPATSAAAASPQASASPAPKPSGTPSPAATDD